MGRGNIVAGGGIACMGQLRYSGAQLRYGLRWGSAALRWGACSCVTVWPSCVTMDEGFAMFLINQRKVRWRRGVRQEGWDVAILVGC